MLSMYPACFYKEKNGYSVLFPDFPCGTCGDDLDDAMRMAIDFLAGQLHDLKCDGESYPVPTPIEDVKLDSDFEHESAFVSMVTVDVDEYAKKHFEKPVKKTLTIPAWLNEKAIEQGINFSAVLREALEVKLNV